MAAEGFLHATIELCAAHLYRLQVSVGHPEVHGRAAAVGQEAARTGRSAASAGREAAQAGYQAGRSAAKFAATSNAAQAGRTAVSAASSGAAELAREANAKAIDPAKAALNARRERLRKASGR